MSKSRYVTFCQQLLATAVVMALAFTAAGVLDLRITPGADSSAEQSTPAAEAPVAPEPVAPRVRQVSFGEKAPAPAPAGQAPTVRGMPLVATSGTQSVSGLATVGVTWDQTDPQPEDGVVSQVRTLSGGRWSGWEELEYHDDHGPDAGDTSERDGTDPSVVGEADRVEVRVFSAQRRAPKGLRVVLIDPGNDKTEVSRPALRGAGTIGSDRGDLELSAAKTAGVTQPTIYSRAQWGADERIRESGNPSYGTIQGGFVHHTVNANNYTAAQVPALIRGIYAYHVKGRGWRDLGYNFLIDRFGKIWEGRYGGITKAVQGAHTEGYNEVSFAGSAIGNFDVAQPPQAVVNAFASLMAWKLSLYGVKADSMVTMKGRRFHAISGHRDTKSTACPGRYLYAKIPEIRRLAAAIQAKGSAPAPKPTPTPTPKPTPTPTPTPTVPNGPAITPKPASQLPSSLNVLGSSWPDLYVREKSTDKIKVLQTGGQLNFSAPASSGRAWSDFGTLTLAGDLDGDGKGDLVARNKTERRTYVIAGNGAGAFPSVVSSTKAYASYRWLVGAGDIDGDGRSDLLAGDSADRLLLLRGDGKGAFLAPQVLSSRWGARVVSAVADVTGDGHPDLLVKGRAGKLELYPTDGAALTRVQTLPVPVSSASTVLAGDVSGDKRPDVLVRGADGQTLAYLGTAAGSVSSRAYGPFGFLSGVAMPSAGPVSTGGGLRVVGGGAGNRLVAFTSNQRSNVSGLATTSLTLPDAAQLINVGDWNGDGKADLASRTATSDYLWIRLGDGKGGFGEMQLMGKGFAGVRQLAAVGDVTGDKRPDLVGRTAQGVMVVYAGDGEHAVRSPFRAPAKLRSFNQIGAALWNGSDFASLLLSAGGGFTPYAPGRAAAALARVAPAGSLDWVIGPGDVDGDRLPDLVVRDKASGDVYLVPGTLTGLGPKRLLVPGLTAYDLAG